MEPILDVRRLTLHFHTFEGRARVINGVDLTIGRGESVALVGETGCGKSMTARAILGLLPSNAEVVCGEIWFKGRNLLTLAEREWRTIRGNQIAMIFQDPSTALNPVFAVGEQLLDVLIWQHRRDRSRPSGSDLQAYRKRCLEVLRLVRIPDPEATMARYPIELSGGMRQRVLIALALIKEPELLIAEVQDPPEVGIMLEDEGLRWSEDDGPTLGPLEPFGYRQSRYHGLTQARREADQGIFPGAGLRYPLLILPPLDGTLPYQGMTHEPQWPQPARSRGSYHSLNIMRVLVFMTPFTCLTSSKQ
ncbi:MAG: ABC transporter ATP-binding protein [Candidatus Bathyarchaeia archaeon]